MSDKRASTALTSLRYLWRGTRRRNGPNSAIPSELAGWFVDDEGDQRSVAEIRAGLAAVAGRADLNDTEMLICSEFYGLHGYPSDLATGKYSLVGSVPSAYGSLAKRSTVSALLASATAKIERVLQDRPSVASVYLVPEIDPVDRCWLDDLWRTNGYTATQQARLIESAFYAALSLIERSAQAPALRTALRAWAASHGVPVGIEPIPASYRYEQRRAANAAAAVALRGIIDDPRVLDSCLRGEAFAGWAALPLAPHSMRTAEQSSHGAMTAGRMSADDLVLAAGDIFEGVEESERLALAVFAEFESGRATTLLPKDDLLTVVWAFGRGLAAQGSWLLVDLAQWASRELGPCLTTVSLVSWASHVASLHLHDDLAWRFARNAEQQLGGIPPASEPNQRQRALVRFQLDLIRSGCCVREADRLSEVNRHERSALRVIDGFRYVGSAQAAWTEANEGATTHPLQGMEVQIRAAEILFLAYRLRLRGHAVKDFMNEDLQLETILDRCDELLLTHPRPGDADDQILRRRVNLLASALDHARIDE